MVTLTAASLRRRFLILTALRWSPIGLMMPVFVLLPLERGLTLAEFGLVASVQGLIVFFLELPTGGLADTVGRRRVLLAACVVSVAATAIFLVAMNPVMFMLAMALNGVFRALESGPLQAWYVDATREVDAAAEFEKGLSSAGVVLGAGIAFGSLAGGGLVALGGVGPLEALAVPVAVSLGLQVLGLIAVAVLMVEVPPAASGGIEPLKGVGQAMARGVGLLRRNLVLAAVVAVELTWGFGMTAFEVLFPIRLEEILGSADRASAILGPTAAAAWVAFATGSALVPWSSRRIGMSGTAALTRILQGITVVAMGWAAGLVGAITAYLACYAVHGTSGPAHQTLLHRQVTGPLRATVLSLNSMAAQAAGAIGLLVLTAIAGASTVSTAMYVAAGVLALGALLYLPSRRQERTVLPVESAAA